MPPTNGQEHPPSPKDIVKEAMEAYNIASQEEQEALRGAASQPLPDCGVEPDFEEVKVTEDSEDVLEVGLD